MGKARADLAEFCGRGVLGAGFDDSVGLMSEDMEFTWVEPSDAFDEMTDIVHQLQEIVWKHQALGDRYSDALVEIRARGWVDEWNAFLLGEEGEGDGLGNV